MIQGSLCLIFLLVTIQCSQVSGRQHLSLTIYNDGFAVVRDVRHASFDQGTSKLYFTDVPSSIVPETVMIKAPREVQVYEQSFENNLMDRQALYRDNLGGPVCLSIKNQHDHKGRLLSAAKSMIMRSNSSVDIYDGGSISGVELTTVSDTIVIRPTLVWTVHSPTPQKGNIEISYRTRNIEWKADYILKIHDSVSLEVLLTIDNNSGSKFQQAKIKVIAGGTNDAARHEVSHNEQTQHLSDYHKYNVPFQANLNESSRKQIQLLNADIEEFLTYLHCKLSTDYTAITDPIDFQRKIEIENSLDNGLGIPLPKGTVTIYNSDNQYVGRDLVNHIARNENITLTIGKSFDVVGKIKMLKYRQVHQRNSHLKNNMPLRVVGYFAAKQLTIFNRGSDPCRVKLCLYNKEGDKNIISAEPQDWERESAHNLVMWIDVGPGESEIVTWTEKFHE